MTWRRIVARLIVVAFAIMVVIAMILPNALVIRDDVDVWKRGGLKFWPGGAAVMADTIVGALVLIALGLFVVVPVVRWIARNW